MTKLNKERVFDFSPGRAEKEIISHLDRFVIGQQRAKKRIADILWRRKTGLRDPRRPLGAIFLLGPTGVGKTELIKATADFLFGNLGAYTHINCPNFENGHEISQLIGSPAGYVGSGGDSYQEPFLSQENIDKNDLRRRTEEIKSIEKQIKDYQESMKSISSPQRELIKEIELLIRRVEALKNSFKNSFFSLVLFDEFEKAHPKLREMLLEILSDGALSLMNGERTDFSNAIIALTGNVASEEIKEEIGGSSKIGFHSDSESMENLSERIWKIVLARLEKTVSPEILGRIGKESVVVCNFLNPEEMAAILELQIKNLAECVKKSAKPFQLFIGEDVKRFLLGETQDRINIALGARALLNVFKKRIEAPLNKLLAKDEDEGGIVKGDFVEIRFKESEAGRKKLEFTCRTAEN